MTTEIEDVVRVSPRGQIVIPKEIRRRLDVRAGEKLLVVSREREILLKKLRGLSIEEVAGRMEVSAKKARLNVDGLIDEAVQWARSKG